MTGGHAVHFVWRCVLTLPTDLAGGGIDRIDGFLFTLARERVDAARGENRRGVAEPDLGFPFEVEPFRIGRGLFGYDAVAVGASPARPVGGEQWYREQRNESHSNGYVDMVATAHERYRIVVQNDKPA